jgi:hypothetical protein
MNAVITVTAAIEQNEFTDANAPNFRIAAIGASFTGIPENRRRSSTHRVIRKTSSTTVASA